MKDNLKIENLIYKVITANFTFLNFLFMTITLISKYYSIILIPKRN